MKEKQFAFVVAREKKKKRNLRAVTTRVSTTIKGKDTGHKPRIRVYFLADVSLLSWYNANTVPKTVNTSYNIG
jgi:hypothetical protein